MPFGWELAQRRTPVGKPSCTVPGTSEHQAAVQVDVGGETGKGGRQIPHGHLLLHHRGALVAEPCEEETGEDGHAPFRYREVGLLFLGTRQVEQPATLLEQDDLTAEGYVIQPLGGGDYAIRIRHDDSRRIRIEG